MFILLSILALLASVVLAIELANIVAYGWFAMPRHTGHIELEVKDGQLSPFDFEIISCDYGYISIVPMSLFADYYYQDDSGRSYRILRFTALHREIQQKFQQLQNV